VSFDPSHARTLSARRRSRAPLIEEGVWVRRLGAGAQSTDELDVSSIDEGAHEHRTTEERLGDRSRVAVGHEPMTDRDRDQRELHRLTGRRGRFDDETTGPEDAGHLELARRAP